MSAEPTEPVGKNGGSKFRIVLRLVYSVTLLVLTIAVALSGDKEKIETIVGSVLNALNVIDPFYIARHYYLFIPFYHPPVVPPAYWYLFPDLAEPQTFYDLVVRSGWIAGSFLAVSTTIMYFVVADIRRKHDGGNVLIALLLSFVVAFPLKWGLIGLVWAFGWIAGFMSWLSGTVIGMIEAALQAHHIYKGGLEVKKVVHEMHTAANPPSSV